MFSYLPVTKNRKKEGLHAKEATLGLCSLAAGIAASQKIAAAKIAALPCVESND